MNKKWLLGLGGVAAIVLPVSTVIACNDDKKKDETVKATKTAVVTVAKPDNVAATVAGDASAYTLAVTSTDTAVKADLETALTGMVAKAADDTATPTFAGTWDKDFDGSKNETFTYTVKADGYKDVTFAVTVTGNVEPKTAVVTVASPANVAAAVAGSDSAYTLAVKSADTAVKADLETALTGMVAKAADDTATPTFAGTWDKDFDGSKNDTYTYTVKADGYKDVTFAVTVTGNAAAPAPTTGASPAPTTGATTPATGAASN